jgi:hypothetical protein
VNLDDLIEKDDLRTTGREIIGYIDQPNGEQWAMMKVGLEKGVGGPDNAIVVRYDADPHAPLTASNVVAASIARQRDYANAEGEFWNFLTDYVLPGGSIAMPILKNYLEYWEITRHEQPMWINLLGGARFRAYLDAEHVTSPG